MGPYIRHYIALWLPCGCKSLKGAPLAKGGRRPAIRPRGDHVTTQASHGPNQIIGQAIPTRVIGI